LSTYAPGCSGSRYKDRSRKWLESIYFQRGDRNVFIDGAGPYCLIVDREYEKVEIEEVGINTSRIEASWPTFVCLPIRKKSRIVSGDQRYIARNSPADMHDGWTTVTLQLDCAC